MSTFCFRYTLIPCDPSTHTDTVCFWYTLIRVPLISGTHWYPLFHVHTGTLYFRHTLVPFISGTHWYHSHVHHQRSNGAYGAFIVKRRVQKPHDLLPHHVMLLSDWTHDWNAEEAMFKIEQVDLSVL